MDIIKSVFKFKRAEFEKLKSYGFLKEGGSLVFRTRICETMRLTVAVDGDGDIKTEVWDTETEEPYTLFLVDGASGEFVGRVREEYTKALEEIAENCFETQIFKCKNTAEILQYARKRYGDKEEYLWEKFPDNAVLRRGDTGKWYAVILTVPYSKFGIEREGTVEVIDVRMDPGELERTVDDIKYFRGWHMNKKRWVTMLLDGSAPLDEIISRLDESYKLATK